MIPILRTSARRWLLVAALGAWLLILPGLTVTAASPETVRRNDTAAPQTATGKRAVVRGRGAVLRDEPNGKTLQNLPLASAVMAVARTADSAWIQVELKDGTPGWIDLDELVIFGLKWLPVNDVAVAAGAASAPADAEAEAVVAEAEIRVSATVNAGARRLNIRQGPGTNYAVIASLPSGAGVTAIARSQDSGWVQIQLEDGENSGWVSAPFLDLSPGSADLPVSEQLSQARPARAASSQSVTAGLSGTLIFQQSSGGKIYRYNLGTGSLLALTTGLDPALSPDGQTVAFIRDDAGPGLYLIGVDGSNERRIFAEDKLRAPAWSPDGSAIAFSRVVGQSACRDVGFGLCVPDNPYLVTYPLVTRDQRGLSRVDAQGDGFRDIASAPGATAPAWGANGIIYHSAGGLQVASVDGAADPGVVSAEYRFQDPDWHPNLNRILFFSLEKDHREIFVANDDGSGLQALTRPTSLFTQAPQNVAPVWSPDGKSILFLSNRSGDWAFWVMDADGGNLRQIRINVPITYTFNDEQVVSWGK